MFSQKYKTPIICSKYLNIYSNCNIGCHFCKFNKNVICIKQNKIDFNEYKNEKVLMCYSVDPYPIGYDKEIVPNIVKKLHDNNCNIVFLTRRADCLINDLIYFKNDDFIGVSISENNIKDSSIEDIIKLFELAKQLKIKTWISLEPIDTFEFVNNILKIFNDKVDFIRIGKNDLVENENWEKIKYEIKK